MNYCKNARLPIDPVEVEEQQALARTWIEQTIAEWIVERNVDAIDRYIGECEPDYPRLVDPTIIDFEEWLTEYCHRPDIETILTDWACGASMLIHAEELAADYIDFLFEEDVLS